MDQHRRRPQRRPHPRPALATAPAPAAPTGGLLMPATVDTPQATATTGTAAPPSRATSTPRRSALTT